MVDVFIDVDDKSMQPKWRRIIVAYIPPLQASFTSSTWDFNDDNMGGERKKNTFCLLGNLQKFIHPLTELLAGSAAAEDHIFVHMSWCK